MTESAPQPAVRTVWALTDDRPGNTAQALGVTDALAKHGWSIEEKPIRYTGWAGLPNSVRRATLLGVSEHTRAGLSKPWPDLVVAAGRRLAPVARWIKKQSHGHTKLTQIMFPGRSGAKDFDLIAVPDHDDLADIKTWPSVITMTGAPSRVSAETLSPAAEKGRTQLGEMPHPRIAVIVGGATRRKPFNRAHALDLGARVADLSKAQGGSVLLTTSRRSGLTAEQVLLQTIPDPRHVHLWGQEGENPYLGYLALADFIVVTGDSVTMCAEACATDKPVYIYAPPGSVSAKHARLHQQLYDLGMAKPLGTDLEDWSHPPLLPAVDIADAIRALFE